uniref:non-specific serine/threonine protein kinase n=1 Tax=Heliotropium calcicola TaxID=1799583 RepID=A0A126X152_9ASTE|nr:putative LOV domain-containing protein [Heliotropium calcicola]
MEPSGTQKKKPSTLMPPLPRDPRGSLEVFNPSTYSSSRPTDPVFASKKPWMSWKETPGVSDPGESTHQGSWKSRMEMESEIPRQGSWKSWMETSKIDESEECIVPPKPPTRGNVESEAAIRPPNVLNQPGSEEITTWMALKDSSDSASEGSTKMTLSAIIKGGREGQNRPQEGEVDVAAQRAAEWGLVLKTDNETGKLQGVQVRTSGDDNKNNNDNKTSGSRRDSSNSMRSSGDLSDEGTGGLRVSQDLKDALSTFQQTFVVSDATKPDYPIMYASAGFFRMTGYTPKEVIGRNCRFMQGADTNPEDVAKIREALQAGMSYCGRLLNYKKDGTPFWNLLTITPIKDETGKTLKYIGMQVEVSKHTEGFKDKMTRPNGLPESLIRYDARQKDMAVSSVTELVDAVKKPRVRALSESSNRPHMRKSGGGSEGERGETVAKSSSATSTSHRRHSHAGTRSTMEKISEIPEKKPKKSRRLSFLGIVKKSKSNPTEDFDINISMDGDDDDDDEESEDDGRPDSVDDKVRKKEMRKGIDLATTLERIEKNFVITDPRLPDNPIIFASDSFLELTEYSREEILGRNCRFLQGPETDPATVRKIRDAIDNQTEVTVQLINYTKSGKKFWNLFHLQPMRDQKGEVQYFIGVQLDGSEHVEPQYNCIPEATAQESTKLIKETAKNVDEAARELPDANQKPDDLWANHSKLVHPKPHRKDSPAWKAIQKVLDGGEQISLKHFKPIKPLGSGDTGSVHLVELYGTGQLFAMKAMDKGVMLNRNKVHRACAEREILDMMDHPFLPALYASFQTPTHVCLITDYYPGGELFMLLDRQPTKVLKEDAVRFYAAEVIVALEYLHCQGIIYRDLKPENILLQSNGHVSLTDFDLSCLTSCKPQLLIPDINEKKKGQKSQQSPIFMAEPMRASNSFVGTEEYIAPEIITGAGHTSAVDWWALGILLYEMLYGYTPFRGKTRQKTFTNILQKDLKFPGSIKVSLQAKQLIYRLLHRDPKNRLGSREGANEVKKHSFFNGINWALVRCMDPPKLETVEFKEGEKETDPGLVDLQTNVF